MYKKCVECKKTMPEYLVGKYPKVFKNPLCPICALKLTNIILGKPPGTPFAIESDQEGVDEAETFLYTQCKRNLGGHLINPPEECQYAFRIPDGGEWVDLGNCNRACNEHCVRYYQWKRMTSDERKTELFENGIING